jgi:hypothetical protein
VIVHHRETADGHRETGRLNDAWHRGDRISYHLVGNSTCVILAVAMNRNHFRQLAEVRIEEALVLFAQGLYDGAYYLAGYAVECGLKACIAKLTNQEVISAITDATHGVLPWIRQYW